MTATLLLGSCEARLRDLADCSVDAVVTDPPAGIGFMGREWDSDKGGRDLPRGFGPWLAGMVDAAGSLALDAGPRECMLEIHGARNVLELIRVNIGGKIVERGEWALWRTASVDHAREIAALLKRFNPQGAIGRVLETWQVVLRLAHFIEQGAPAAPVEERWLDLREMLRAGEPCAADFIEMEHEHQWIAWLAGVMRECLRVLRPGGYALVWALPRTSHWTATAIEDAGFEIRDRHHHIGAPDERTGEFLASLDKGQREMLARIIALQDSPILAHLSGTGFPKSLDVSKAMDAHELVGRSRPEDLRRLVQGCEYEPSGRGRVNYDHGSGSAMNGSTEARAPVTPNARRWKGHGTALKPAVEHWILARKPLIGTYAENVLKHGTGALRIDACRIGGQRDAVFAGAKGPGGPGAGVYGASGKYLSEPHALGRWPAHLSLEHADDCRVVGTAQERHTIRIGERIGDDSRGLEFGMGRQATTTTTTTTERYDCVEGCPVRTLDEQSGERKAGGSTRGGGALGVMNDDGWQPKDRDYIGRGDGGGASRFFYIAKPSRREKDAGLEDLPAVSGGEATGRADGSAGTRSPRAGAGRTGGGRNQHPTVKAVALMRWLVRLITPPGGLVLDPFTGSGTTGVACAEEGLRFLGIEQDAKFHETARLRLKRAHGACETELPAQRDLAAVLIAQPKSEDGTP